MKYIIILLAALSFSTTDIAAQKFGHINSQVLLDTLPETQTAQAELEALNSEFEQAIKEQSTALEALGADIQKNQATWGQVTLELKYKQYQADEQRLQEAYTSAQQTLQQREQELLAPIIEKARTAVKKVGVDNGFTYIFDLQNGGIIYEGGEDVLPLVLAEMGI